jgi:hypothetical protein
MVSKYKGYGRGERLLEEHIPRFNNFLMQRMLIEASALKDQIQRFTIRTEPESFTIKFMHAETAYWAITFTHPVIQYIPECFRHITKNVPYYFEKGQWLEHVPSYIPNINHVAMNVVYNGGNGEFTNNTSGLFAKYIYVDGTPMTFYSYNILNRWHAKKKYLDESVHEYVRKCFDYCYWRFPTPLDQDEGSCIDNMIYATTSRIREVLIMRKTLVKIFKVEDRVESRTLLERDMRGKFAEVLLLCDDGIQFVSQKRHIFIPEHVIESIKENDVVNAVLIQVDVREKKKDMIMIGNMGVVSSKKPQAVISIILSKMLQNIEDYSSPTRITDVDKLRFEITNFFQTNYKFFESTQGWGKDIPEKVSESFVELFPMFIEDDGNVYQMSPTMITFLSTIHPKTLEDKKTLTTIVKLLDMLKINSNFWGSEAIGKLRTSDTYEEIQGNPSSLPNELLKAVPRIVNRIVYSRIFSRHYSHWK